MAFTVLSISARLLFRRLGILLVGNILWLLLTLPVVTWPAATGALFYLVHRVVLEERALDPHYARLADFWEGFRRFGWLSTRLLLLDLAAAAGLAVSLWFYGTSEIEPLRWLVGPVALVGISWLGMQLYLFPIMVATPERSLRAIFKHAFLTALGFPLYTLTLLLALSLLAALSLVLLGPVLLVLFAMLAVTQTVAVRNIRIRRGEIPATHPETGDSRQR